MGAISLKTFQKTKSFEDNLKDFNTKVLALNSNARQVMDKVLKGQDQAIMGEWEQLRSYLMLSFLCVPSFEVNEDNFKLAIGLHFAIECNSFGISNSELIRIGTALYNPSNFINHSCAPNAMIRQSGRRQFLVASQDIEKGQEITISYIDHGIPERIYRRRLLRDLYHFECTCKRCEKQSYES